jgi:hypothetical protein
MRISLNAKACACQIRELADILGVDVNVYDNVVDIGNAAMAKARHLADECNFSTPENDMDTEDAKPNPAETSDDAGDHVILDTPLPDDGTSPNDDQSSSITDELRKWASDRHCKGISHTDALNIGLIADRIDEQFDRICQQQEAVLQSTIDEMAVEIDKMRKEVIELREQRYKLQRERDELQAKLDKASGENKGLRLSIDEQKESINQRKKTIKKLTRDNEKVWKTVHELQAKLDAIRDALDG